MMALVYSQAVSPRLTYTFKVIFKDILGIDVEFTDNLEEFIGAETLKINYSDTALEDVPQFRPSEIIFESGIQNQAVKVDRWEGIPVLFPKSGPGHLPFDPVAMVFYLVSRYEEYIPGPRDVHGRFKPEISVAYEHGFLEKPLVDILVWKLKDYLSQHYAGIHFPEKAYEFLPTVDIDQAFAHKGKGFFRSAGALSKLLLSFRIKEGMDKLRVLTGSRPDPFDNFDFLTGIFSDYKLTPVYFVLMGNYGKFDKNCSHRNQQFRNLLKNLSGKAEVGIHPSYGSYNDPGKLAREIDRLQNITGKKITSSRQHFLKIKLPDTYYQLIDAGISDDHSMGYASMPGFRASTCSTFRAFDPVRNRELPLNIHPFAFMDSAFSDYLKLKPEEYVKFVRPLVSNVKQVSGSLAGIWHNYALSDDKARHDAFLEILKEVSHDQAS
jgi:hypothetical protein